MKKLGHLGIFALLLVLSIYLLELSSLHLAPFLGWGIDGYFVILAVEEVALLVLFVYWLKKKKMLFIFEKQSWNLSRIFYLVLSLVACYFVRQLVNAFYMQYHHLIDNKYIFQDSLSTLVSSGEATFLSTVFYFFSSIIIGPILEETVHRGYFMNTFFPQSKYYLDVIFSALIFGFSHLILSHRDPISLLYFSFLGFFFALVYRYTSNLRLTILCHCLFNFFNHAKPIWIFVYNFIYYRFFR